MDDTYGVPLLISTYFYTYKENVLLLASNLYHAERLANSIASLVGEDNVVLFPADELLHANNLVSSMELTANRIDALYKIINDKKKIVIAHPNSFLRYLPSKELFKQSIISLKVNDHIDINALCDKLLENGYSRVNKIGRSLEFARRGDIVDIYSLNYDNPIRLSFFDDEIESTAFFDIATQESKSKVDIVDILPATDVLFTNEERADIENKLLSQCVEDKNYIGNDAYEHQVDMIKGDIERFNNYECNENLYRYYAYLQNKHYSLFDYMDADLTFVSDLEQLNISYEISVSESRKYLDELLLKGESISHLELFHDLNKLLSKKKDVVTTKKYKEYDTDIEFKVRPIVVDANKNASLINTITSYFASNDKVVIALSSLSQKEIVKNALNDAHIDYEDVNDLNLPKGHVGISLYSLNEGFELIDEKIAYLSAKELFNYHNHISRFASKFKEANALHSYEDLKPGDFVVHEYNGIGQFIDIVTLEIEGIHRDFIYVLYSGGDKLYVPLNQFHLLRKYTGREGYVPRLSSLNTKTWEKTKEKIKARIDELTERLSKLYKDRAIIGGYAFPKDDDFQFKFNSEFPYQLTDDQEQAYRDIRDDMEKPYPMDRLLCGDVGFGKTEIAFRAIFKCINAGKQAALLCPTTLLCRQHYELAKERFASFGIKIAVFSRLIPLKDQKKYIEGIKNGDIHLVIGTHRLLSKDITFKDLGLLVVDEEQRFGVEQKERIKEIKNDVDVLSLSATPIPRTLQMSLVGLRSLSQINTAPSFRSAIQTYVTPYNEAIIRELIEREISRDGQVFYVHNNIYTIFNKANMLSKLVPLAKIGVVHGQMSREEIEDTMMRFYSGDVNLLVATSIIENGLDVPNANMIIVENADNFGLAQLYQIKGRVGRGDRIAYAYLLYNPNKQMNEEASKRLKAIQEFAELGSGYKIAQRDLMIRGAGDILGREQAGFIDSIGIDLYIKLLNDSVRKKREDILMEHKPNRLLNVDAYLPDDYIDKSEKISIYQEIEDAKDIKEINHVSKRLRDIYGRIPKEVNNLLIKKRIDIITSNKEFKSVDEKSDFISVNLSKEFCERNGIALKLFDALYTYMDRVKVSYVLKELRIEIKKEGMWLTLLEHVVTKIHQLYLKL